MADILKLLIPVFLSPKDYTEMLKKLGAFLFWEAYIVTFVLRSIPKVDMALSSVENYGAIGRALSLIPGHENLNLLGFVIALAIACSSYAVQVHDRISDIFGIRYRFDRNYILLPLVRESRWGCLVHLTERATTLRLPAQHVSSRAAIRSAIHARFGSLAPVITLHDLISAWPFA